MKTEAQIREMKRWVEIQRAKQIANSGNVTNVTQATLSVLDWALDEQLPYVVPEDPNAAQERAAAQHPSAVAATPFPVRRFTLAAGTQ
ncbi:MAG: hypothetical protein M3O20_09390 [Acidobacteriota bacterium]|nr:hypothetical protein [Acidobacteriota bacterium]